MQGLLNTGNGAEKNKPTPVFCPAWSMHHCREVQRFNFLWIFSCAFFLSFSRRGDWDQELIPILHGLYSTNSPKESWPWSNGCPGLTPYRIDVSVKWNYRKQFGTLWSVMYGENACIISRIMTALVDIVSTRFQVLFSIFVWFGFMEHQPLMVNYAKSILMYINSSISNNSV